MVLEESGIDPDRFALEWVSSAEAPRFARKVTQFIDRIQRLGPHNETIAVPNPETAAP
jgi:F420-non-reducing hydrogenase iron-sulfur subunit